jgi:hypothetical protein
MARPHLKPVLQKLIDEISHKHTYGGRVLSPSIVKLLVVEEREDGAGVLAPAWLSVVERGRGKRKSDQDSGLVKRIYAWMQRHNMFKSRTPKGKKSEARFITWYINKYGNKQFREKAFIDVYTRARAQCVDGVMKEYELAIGEVTKDIL